ncbi:MAG: amidohydrolase family protein, partial [Planctomycetota bacterium]|nr:amidohydrolase family protein [Planctomycetota bacterium]
MSDRAPERLPGFIDLQVNGFSGVDFSSPALTAEQFASACRALRQKGTAGFLATVITSPLEVYERNLQLMAKAIADFGLERIVLGFHLEGPFISPAPGAVGAHNPAWVQLPDPGLLDRLQEWAEGRIRLVTMAADLPDAEKLCAHAVRAGIAVSLGHHLADAEQIARLADAGASALTHLG